VRRLTLAHDIARAAPSCSVVSVAARNAFKVRPFSGEVVTLAAHTHWVMGVAATQDGRIITCSEDGAVKVWRDGMVVKRICAWTDLDRPVAVAVLSGGAHFIVGSFCAAKLYTLDCAPVRTFKVACAYEASNVFCITALPDGVHFIVGLDKPYNYFMMFHVDGTLVHAFTGHRDRVTALAVTLDGQQIISGSNDEHVKVWSVATKSLLSTCRGHTDLITSVAVTPDGKRVLSGSRDMSVRVWWPDGTLDKTLFRELHTRSVRALVALPDNQHALAGANDIRLFNVYDGAVLRTFKHHTDEVVCLALLPDGLRFVTGSGDTTARIVYHGLAPQA
jgi:WD40 repeat protein